MRNPARRERSRLKRRERVLAERKRVRAVIAMIQRLFWGRRKKHTGLSTEQRTINAMTNWQNSQWLRGGARPDSAISFLAMSRR